MVPQWQQRVTLRIITSTRALRHVVGDDAQTAYDTGNRVRRCPEEIDLVAVYEAVLFDVSLIHQHDHARDAAQTVIQAVDGRVELVVTSQGNKCEHTRPRCAVGQDPPTSFAAR